VTDEKVIGTTHDTDVITNDDAKVFGTKRDVSDHDQRHGGTTKRK
jgi:hypothetical protein